MVFDDMGRGQTVLLIHGFPLCRRMWQPQVQSLVDAGCRVVAPDLPGFGDSPSLGPPWTMDLYGDAIIALLDRLGIEQVVAGGMSMGGYILLNLLDRFPKRVTAAIFIATRAGIDGPVAKERRTRLSQEVLEGKSQSVQEAFSGILFAPSTLSSRPELIREVGRWMTLPPPEGLAAGLIAMRDRPDYTDRLREFKQPSLVIGGVEDLAMGVDPVRHLVKHLPFAQLCLVPEAGHLVNLERPKEVNARILGFLAGLRGSVKQHPD